MCGTQSERWWLGAYGRMRHPGRLGQGLCGSEGEMIRNAEKETNNGYKTGKYGGTRWCLFLLFSLA